MFTECSPCASAHVYAHVSLDYQHSSGCLPYCHPHVTGEELKLNIIRCAFQGMESEAQKKPLCLLRGVLAKSKEDMGNKRLQISLELLKGTNNGQLVKGGKLKLDLF